MIRKIAIIAFYILLPVGIFILLGFAVESNKSAPCRSFRVYVDDQNEMRFVDSAAVIRKVYGNMDTLVGKPFSQIPLSRIRELINTMYYVAESRVYRTIDGHLVADIKQRQPVARIVNSANETFYLEKTGGLMRTSDRYTARVIVVSGYVHSGYSSNINVNYPGDSENISSSEKLLWDISQLVHFIRQNDFLYAWIDHIYVTRRGEFELVPRNGVHIIEFGDIDDMEKKFDKLLTFYENALTHTGWGGYKKINLKFKNQIVCSK